MRDEQVCQAELVTQALEQADDLGLDADVERRHGLVESDQLGPERERAGDADALALTARELMGMAVGGFAPELHRVEQLRDALVTRGGVGAVHEQRLADDLAGGHARVERRVRILEDDLEALAQAAQLVRRQARQLDAVEAHRPARGGDELHGAAGRRRLAAARLADERQRLAALHVERHARDGVDGTAGATAPRCASQVELLHEVAHREQRRLAHVAAIAVVPPGEPNGST